MKNRYQIIAMRSLLGGYVDCEPYQAERWDIVDLVCGRTVGMTRTEVDAKAVHAALGAVAELEARAAAAERCRVAIAMALGADVDTLEAGVLALLADRESMASALAGVVDAVGGEAWVDHEDWDDAPSRSDLVEVVADAYGAVKAVTP